MACLVVWPLLLLHWWGAGEQQLLEKRMAAAGFDLDKYQQLRRSRDRYKRYLASTQPQQHGGIAAAGAEAEAATNGKLKDA